MTTRYRVTYEFEAEDDKDAMTKAKGHRCLAWTLIEIATEYKFWTPVEKLKDAVEAEA